MHITNSVSHLNYFLFLVFLSIPTINSNQLQLPHNPNECSLNKTAIENGFEMFPLIDEKKREMMMVMNETRRKLGRFQICAPCTCGGRARGYCLPSPSCYAINCNIPNRPFGFCSFTPRTCHCYVPVFGVLEELDEEWSSHDKDY